MNALEFDYCKATGSKRAFRPRRLELKHVFRWHEARKHGIAEGVSAGREGRGTAGVGCTQGKEGQGRIRGEWRG
ncbi:hypothetical protein TRAPUB_5417 [Trametes pubescens]|uniref:Uncharacterized protein n=1 Tax=Trametes pubescens TaxID=154538 RepID=A0A1M2V8F5_TRAPU|nr:hypothetical protein TRAPUB_5417 [Trametes pubescens]